MSQPKARRLKDCPTLAIILANAKKRLLYAEAHAHTMRACSDDVPAMNAAALNAFNLRERVRLLEDIFR